jgi:hypothetical protein
VWEVVEGASIILEAGLLSQGSEVSGISLAYGLLIHHREAEGCVRLLLNYAGNMSCSAVLGVRDEMKAQQASASRDPAPNPREYLSPKEELRKLPRNAHHSRWEQQNHEDVGIRSSRIMKVQKQPCSRLAFVFDQPFLQRVPVLQPTFC